MNVPLVFHPNYVTPLPPGHRFPMTKFGAIYLALLKGGLASAGDFHVPEEMASVELLARVHQRAYIDAFCNGSLHSQALRRIGLPWSEGLVARTRTAVAGTLLTARLALQHGIACNTAGGTHHAFADYGSGFCIFNDLAVTAANLLATKEAERILILDLDVHQGDGTATLFRDEERVFTLSIHCSANFPYRKGESDLDISLPVGTGNEVYLKTLHEALTGALTQFKPDLVLYDAGVDPHSADSLGLLDLCDRGLLERDLLVLSNCLKQGVPAAAVVGGGYDRDIEQLALRHLHLHVAAEQAFRSHC